MADIEVCTGCGRDREIKVKYLRICGPCSSWVYRSARKLIFEGHDWWEGYVTDRIEAPAYRVAELYNSGVVDDRQKLLLTRPQYARRKFAKRRKAK